MKQISTDAASYSTPPKLILAGKTPENSDIKMRCVCGTERQCISSRELKYSTEAAGRSNLPNCLISKRLQMARTNRHVGKGNAITPRKQISTQAADLNMLPNAIKCSLQAPIKASFYPSSIHPLPFWQMLPDPSSPLSAQS